MHIFVRVLRSRKRACGGTKSKAHLEIAGKSFDTLKYRSYHTCSGLLWELKQRECSIAFRKPGMHDMLLLAFLTAFLRSKAL
mmetsp:Transcript_35812/g.106886  ORF Transcript_35812/g.106886 Transcript_35812/m.106886 type:complete len:82 (-) Transcript_35812:295-540(-)